MKRMQKNLVHEKTDYGIYHLSWQQFICYLAESILLCAVINYLFYKSVVVYLFMLPIPVWYIRERKRNQIALRKGGCITSSEMH